MRKGSTHSPEARLKMSRSHSGVGLSEEHRRRQSEGKKGKPTGRRGQECHFFGVKADLHWGWKGDEASYSAIHAWVRRNYPKTATCSHCGAEKRTHWANVSGEYRRLDRDDWVELCQGCHSAFDEGGRDRKFLTRAART